MATADPSARSLAGRLCLRFGSASGRTRLIEAVRTPPCHVQRLLFLDPAFPSLARAVVLNSTAGLFAGDRLRLDAHVAAGAAVELTSPAMTRAFAMPEGHAEVQTRLTVAAGGYLEFLPQPTLFCAGARLHQSLEIDLTAGAVAAVGEVLAFGREARGERHAYHELRQRTAIRLDGEPVLMEALSLAPAVDGPGVPGLIGAYAAFGRLDLLCADCAGGPALDDLRARLACGQAAYASASVLPFGAGIGVRVLSDAAHAAQETLRAVVATFRRWHAPC